MERDQRIVDIIAAASENRPADVSSPFNSLVGDKITELVAARRVELAQDYFDDEEAEIEIDLEDEIDD